MNQPPEVSVVLPTFNRMTYLPTAVESVLAQSYHDWELIIVDDGSTDGTQQYVAGIKDPRVTLISLAHTGNPALVRNAGIRRARGRYIAFLDSDDSWLPHKLRMQIPALRSASTCRWSYTAYQRMDEAGLPLAGAPKRPWRPYDGWLLERLLCSDAVTAMPTVIVERALLEEVGGFDESLRCCEDYHLWHRLAMRSPVHVDAAATARVRFHASRLSGDAVTMHESSERLYAKTMQLVTDRRLRSICTVRRLQHALLLARTHSAQRHVLASLRTLFRAFPYAWRYPAWWLAVPRAMVRPFVPDPLRRTYQRLRASEESAQQV